MGSALSQSMRAAGAAQAVDRMCSALASTDSRDGALFSMRALLARIRPADVGVTDRRRLLLWLTMLGALDDAFAFADASLDHLARTDTIGLICVRGTLWMPETEPLRRDARFRRIAGRLRLASYWEKHGPPDGGERFSV